MIKLGFVLLIAVILVQGMLFWKYQRQVKDICRQLSFLMKHDSNMLITREMDFGGIGELADVLNEWLELKRREKKEYLKKEEMISDTYTNLSHDIRTPLTSLDGYFQLMETCEDQEEQRRYMKIGEDFLLRSWEHISKYWLLIFQIYVFCLQHFSNCCLHLVVDACQLHYTVCLGMAKSVFQSDTAFLTFLSKILDLLVKSFRIHTLRQLNPTVGLFQFFIQLVHFYG